jgi:hypothetical protein
LESTDVFQSYHFYVLCGLARQKEDWVATFQGCECGKSEEKEVVHQSVERKSLAYAFEYEWGY